jgi:glutamate-1-semialdehyde 2,1-aminomutase
MSVDRTGVDPGRVADLLAAEERRFVESNQTSRELFERGKGALLAGVPMPWMTQWAGAFPVFATEAEGARFRDADGHEFVDFCLGDTGAMAGHAPGPVVEAVAERSARGITLMLPTGDASRVGEELRRRFGLERWQFALTATDANRFAIRLARAITGRPRIAVYSWCYHGTVDESFAIAVDGEARPRPDNIGPPVDPAETTRAIEFNDLEALEGALAEGDVACVLAEPAMTNAGIVLPEPGYHEELRRLTRERDVLLIADETHTICAGPGGYTAAHGLEPDMLTIGKAIAGGVPAAAYGMTAQVAERVLGYGRMLEASDIGGIGGTLAGNALSLAAMRATLEQVLTDEAFVRMLDLGARFEQGAAGVIRSSGLPWNVTRLGCRIEYHFRPTAPRNGAEAIAADDERLARLLHLFALNRGILMTPFHNMALICPATAADDVDRHTEVFGQAVAELVA